MISSDIAEKFSRWYFSRKALPYWCVLLCDCAIVFFSILTAHLINKFPSGYSHESFPSLFLAILAYLVFYIIGFRLFRTYTGVIRYSSAVDLFRCTGALLVGSILVEIARFACDSDNLLNAAISGHDLMVSYFIAVTLMIGLRISVKVLHDVHYRISHAPHILIFGTREGGISIAKNIINQAPTPYRIEAFLTNLPEMKGHTLLNKPIWSDDDKDLWDKIKRYKIEYVMVSPLVQDYLRNRQELIDQFIRRGLKIMMVQQEHEWDGKSDLTVSSLHEVSVEDLLPREKIEVDLNAIGDMLKGKRILITGAAGSIGGEMVRQVALFEPSKLVLIDQAETPMHDVRLLMANRYPNVQCETLVTSITNQTRMEAIFKEFKPEYVFHAAAYKHVPMMENNPSEAVQNNVYGTRVIADLAVKYGTRKFVMISTDKAVNPTNVMGCSKRICEIYCQALNKEIEEGKMKMGDGSTAVTQFVTTRFGNVLGSNGSVIPLFKEQLRKGGPLTVTHPDIIRFFMLIPEACRLVLEAGTMGKGGEIFVFDMGKPVRIADLAQRMIDLSGAKDVKIQFTGLRNGEKLFEEVLNDAEQTKPTHHPKIKVAAVREYPYELALKNEIELHELSFGYDDMAIVKKMKEIVPEFKSKQSKYEALD